MHVSLLAPVVALFLISISMSAVAAEPPTADDLLKSFEGSVEKLNRLQIEWKQALPRGEIQTTVFRDGPRWKNDRWFLQQGTSPFAEGSRREQTVISDEILKISLQYNSATDPPLLMPIITAIRDKVSSRTWLQIGQPAILFGRIPGDAGYPLWTIMRESGSLKLLETERIGDRDTYVLESQNKYGHHKLWLDPAAGSLPRRIEVRKRAGNLLNDEQLGTTTIPKPSAEADPKPLVQLQSRRPHKASWLRIDNIQIENLNGAFTITGFEQQGRITFVGEPEDENDGQPKPVNKMELRFRVDIDPRTFPDDAFKFAVAIPNGTMVFVADKSPLEFQGPARPEHEWIDGQVRERSQK